MSEVPNSLLRTERIPQQSELASPEVLANARFTMLFRRIIDELSITRGPKPRGAQLWTAILPRIVGWEPAGAGNIENAVNRIYVTKSSGWSAPDLNMQELAIAELSEDGTYLSREFRINDDTVGVTINHLRIRPASHERPLISTNTIGQAPLDLLTSVSDEIERLLPQITS